MGCTVRLPTPAGPISTATPLPAPAGGGSTSLVTPTLDLTSTVMALSPPQQGEAYISPDKQWRVEGVTYACVQTDENAQHALDQLQLVQASTGYTKTIATQLQTCGGLGAFGLAGRFWSPNSRYFYYTDAREGTPDGCGYWAGSLLRFDIQDQQTEPLGGGPQSPDGKKLATWQGAEVVVWDVDQGELTRKPAVMPNLSPGPIVWSPDSQALVYLQIATPCPPAGKSYGVRLDVATLKQTLLFTSERPTFAKISWKLADHLTLTAENEQHWRYTFSTQNLEQLPPNAE